MTGEQQGASCANELLHTTLSSFKETSITGPKALVQSQAIVLRCSEHGKKESGRHSLAITLHRQVDKIAKPRKFDHIFNERIKSSQATMQQQVMALCCLHSTEIRTGNETLLDHWKDWTISPKASTSGLINARNKPQEGRFTGTIMTDHRNTLTMPNGATDATKRLDFRPSACLT